jgi:hypothetical protein
MPSLSDQQLSYGFRHVEDKHGESIKILDGDEAGLEYIGVILTAGTSNFVDEISDDLREKSIVCFSDGKWPKGWKRGNTMQDSYGNTWRQVKLVENPHDNSVDFEIERVVDGIDEN